jgi:predicted XRE-type DNA-binding protein
MTTLAVRKNSIYICKIIKLRRNAWLLANGPCKKCSSWEQLEMDHIDPKTKNRKESRYSKLWKLKESRRNIELAKCQVLCYNCHNEKSRKEKEERIKYDDAIVLEVFNLKTKGLTQKKISEKLGISQQLISLWIQGKSRKKFFNNLIVPNIS